MKFHLIPFFFNRFTNLIIFSPRCWNKNPHKHLFSLLTKYIAMKIYLTSFFLLLFSFNALGKAALSGKLTDADTGEPILFGDVVVYKDGKLITGEQTDFDGNYIISPIDPGKYDVVFKYVGYPDIKIEDVIIKKDKETSLTKTKSW